MNFPLPEPMTEEQSFKNAKFDATSRWLEQQRIKNWGIMFNCKARHTIEVQAPFAERIVEEMEAQKC